MWPSAEIALLPCYQNDALSFGLSVLLLLGYHVALGIRERRDPSWTVQAINCPAPSEWVAHVMREGKDILAVQTLRNSTMAATFLASTAVLMATLSLVCVLYRADRSWKISDAADEVALSPNP